MSGTPAHLPGVLAATVARDPDRAILARRDGTRWADVSAASFALMVDDLACGLVASGIGPGERIGLFARTRFEWTLCDFAILSAGAVTVPLYETSSSEQVRWILQDSGATGCFVDGPGQLAAVRAAVPDLPVWVLDTGGDLPTLVEDGRGVDRGELVRRQEKLSPDVLATIVYTSGTTGRPKGCEITHGNFLAECISAVEMLPELFERPDASTLHFLPLAHIFGRMIQFACVLAGVRSGHSDLARISKDLLTFRPTFLLAVPRVFERVYETAERKAVADGRGRIFAIAASTAVAASKARDRRFPDPFLELRRRIFDKLVYAKLRAAFGGRVEWAVSGGAPLGDRLGHFFRGAGITVLEGYGLTETTAATTVSNRRGQRIGTVGRPLPGMEIRTAEDGEVQVRGDHVFGSYRDAPAETAAAFTADGWFRTGDLGSIDDEGYLTITGRSKEIIVTAAGKNIAPAPLEDRIRAARVVSQAMVLGDGRPHVVALVTLDPESGASPDDPAVRAEVQAAIDAANETVSVAEGIRKFAILPTDFTQAGGQLTPTLKIRRQVVVADYADVIDSLYTRRS